MGKIKIKEYREVRETINFSKVDWQVVNNKGKTIDLRIGNLIIKNCPAEVTGDYCE